MQTFPSELILETISHQPFSLASYDDDVLVIVNTASECGFTSQYQQLEALYQRYQTQGFHILGFPCNQFAGQEPAGNAQIQQFCTTTYQVSFDLFSKTEVNGAHAHPLFEWLKEAAPGVMGTQRIKWNFTKFLVSRDRQRVHRFAPTTVPEQMIANIELELPSPQND
ncbi:glutathione peroxidase [Celerinatantimonas yamalensis]|uniref:Glutathione peroxidase n=1 Tax=Celerinatantimonas yamalensis TaxID=559956 RepID=A0ABW9G4I9_9GAMM